MFNFKVTFSLVKNRISARSENPADWKSTFKDILGHRLKRTHLNSCQLIEPECNKMFDILLFKKAIAKVSFLLAYLVGFTLFCAVMKIP